MQYREIAPCLQLAPFVRCFWTLSNPAPLDPQIIIPDGCTELVFHLGDRFQRFFDDGRTETQPLGFVVGQMERAVLIQPMGRIHIFAARFHPAGLSAFTRIPQQELTGRMVTCEELWGSTASRFLMDDPETRMEPFLLRQLVPRFVGGDFVSDRQQRRRFQDLVGLSPKRLERIQRLQRAMAQLGTSELADVAQAAGYYDQPHFTREFREFTGQSPAQFLREPHAISDFFVRGVRNVQDSEPVDLRY